MRFLTINYIIVIFGLCESCKPFGKSYFESNHLAPEESQLEDIYVNEDEVIPNREIDFYEANQDFDCERDIRIEFTNTDLIQSIQMGSTEFMYRCILKIILNSNAFGKDSIKINVSNTKDGELSSRFFNLFVEQLGDDDYIGGDFQFNNQSNFALSSTEYLEITNQQDNQVMRLKIIDTLDNDAVASNQDLNFANYVNKDSSVQLNTTTSGVQLTNSTSSDLYDESFAELDASWTPQWSSLMSYWKFNEENNSTEARDSKGSVLLSGFPAATFNGNQKWLKKAAYFNGSFSAYLTSTLYTQTTNITFAGWIYIEALPLDSQFFYIGQPGSTGWGPRIGNGCAAGTTFNIILGGVTCTVVTGSPTATTGSWIHIVVRRDGSTWNLFINGLPAQTNTPTNNPSAPAVGILFGQNFNGYLDDFAFWQAHLNWEEIAAIYNRQAAKYGGSFVSRVIDTKTITLPAESLEVKTSLPFGKDLSNSAESSSNSDTGYATSPINFASGLISYFRFNNTPAAIINSTTISSSVGANATAMNGDGAGLSYISTRMSSGVRFNSTDDGVNLGTSLNPTTQSFTISFWERSVLNGTSFWTFLSNRNSATGNAGIWITQRNTGGTDVGKLRVQLNTSALVNDFSQGTVNISDGEWHHVVIVVDRTTQRMHWYVDGKVDVANIDISGVGNIQSTLDLLIGRDASTYAAAGSNFRGDFDEFAMWNRALSQVEAIELYRRQANNIRYQIRWCDMSDCSDGTSFVGIDGSIASYLSEALNTSSFTASASVNSSGLSFVFSQLASVYSGFQTWFNLSSSKRYFQYRAFLESIDSATSTLCDSSNRHQGMTGFTSGTQPCMPDIKSVKFGPSKYDSSAHSVTFNYPAQMNRSFYDLKSFEVEYGNNLCQASLGFQLGLAGQTDWYVYKKDNWRVATSDAETNSQSEINSAIAKFSSQIGRGRLNLKIFLQSRDSLSGCEIKKILAKGTQ